MHILDLKLISSSPIPSSATALAQHRLSIYTTAMSTWTAQWDGTDRVTSIMQHISNDVGAGVSGLLSRPDSHSRASTLGTSPNPLSAPEAKIGYGSYGTKGQMGKTAAPDWSEMVLQHTNFYLRITLTLDLSLSKGQFPADADFPDDLRAVRVCCAQYFPLITLSPANCISPCSPSSPLHRQKQNQNQRVVEIGKAAESGSGETGNGNNENLEIICKDLDLGSLSPSPESSATSRVGSGAEAGFENMDGLLEQYFADPGTAMMGIDALDAYGWALDFGG
jgi:hypothetical protein